MPSKQEQYLQGVYAAKRGSAFEYHSPSAAAAEPSQQVTLGLSGDGATLQVFQSEEDREVASGSVNLVDIEQIILSTELHPRGFSLRLRRDSFAHDGNDPNASSRFLNGVFVCAASAALFNQWVLTLTCGANAFQQQKKKEDDDVNNESSSHGAQATRNLIWQAVRLRIFELGHVMELANAAATVTRGCHDILDAEQQECEGLQDAPFFLTCASS